MRDITDVIGQLISCVPNEKEYESLRENLVWLYTESISVPLEIQDWKKLNEIINIKVTPSLETIKHKDTWRLEMVAIMRGCSKSKILGEIEHVDKDFS